MRSSHLYAVILAGGSGTRFWPASRRSFPKQFLNIIGPQTLFQQTLRRIKPLVDGDRIFVVTNAAYRRIVERQSAAFRVPRANILLERAAKNTAPSIAWAAARIRKKDPEAIMAVLPSDHLILKQKSFLRVIRKAVDLAGQDYLVTLGIVPTRPETGYGYLQTAKAGGIMKVGKFTEKPSLARAKTFLRRKNYFWNSGMFVWKADVILSAFQKHLPGVHRLVSGRTCSAYMGSVWSRMPSISIDYGILEKANNAVAVSASDIGWSDLGSWESLMEASPKDGKGNILRGDVMAVDCTDTLVWGDQRVIAPIGLEHMVIIDTPDALLVCPKKDSQDVKDIVNKFRAMKRKEI